MDKLPTGLTADEAYNHLVALLAENYEREVEMLDSVDPTIKTNLAIPGAAKAAEGSPLSRNRSTWRFCWTRAAAWRAAFRAA